MIIAKLVLDDPADPGETVEVDITLDPGYGSTAELAHELLMVCLSAEWPIVVNSDGALMYIPPGTLRSLATRAV